MQYAKNISLESNDTKNKIFRYLETHVNTHIKLETITNKQDLEDIRNNDYIICPRFNGTRSWIIFFQIDDQYYAVNFPKHNQFKRKNIIIHPIDISVTKEFYYGTIMDGIFFRIDENCYLVVDEVYILAGENQLLKSKDDRLDYLAQYITQNIMRNANYHLYVSQYFQTNEKSLKNLYEKIKSDTKIQELIFYPKLYGRKIYNYIIINMDLVDTIIKTAKFRMQKTASPDVYNLLSINTGGKIDIAYIPDMETSKKCKQWFKDNKAKELLTKCHHDMAKNKWIPMELIEEDIAVDDLEVAGR